MNDPYKGLRLPPSESLEEMLLGQVVHGFYSVSNVTDVLLAREKLWFSLNQVVPIYRGYVGSTVDGVLVYAQSWHGVIDALKSANPPGRLGYYCWIEPQPSP